MRLLQNLQISKAEPNSAEKQEISAVHIISILRPNSTRFFFYKYIVQHSKLKSHSRQAPKFYNAWE